MTDLIERYLRLGLQVGRHVDGIVDAYYGPPELAAEVEADPPVDPHQLASAAEALLDELDDGWLRDQVLGLRTYASVLSGETRSYADEVEGCYGVRPVHTDETIFAAAHERLDELLPGAGPAAARYERWRESTRIRTEEVEATMAAVIEEARAWTRDLVELPEEEGVALETVHGVPWLAFCDYLGDFRSKIEVNVDLPISAMELLHLTIHETYAGHHAERARKEHVLVRGRGLLEETLVLVPAPQALLAEGIAELAVTVVLESDAGPRLASPIDSAGVEFDLAHALAVERALQPCQWVEVNAALMFHQHGASEAEVHAYLMRWGLLNADLADHVIRFLKQPTSRAYVMNYPAGRELCSAYAADDHDRFRHLLTEQVRVGELLKARDVSH